MGGEGRDGLIMCKCTPTMRTPFCGAPGCEWPAVAKPPDVRTDSAQCPHTDLDINFHLTSMVDSNVGSLHVWAKCKICEKRMNFGRGLSMGASSKGPTRDSEPDKLGILIPMIAESDEPSKEWGFFLSGPRLVVGER